MNFVTESHLRWERWKFTARVVRMLEVPMLILSGIWTALLIVEFTRGLSPWLQAANDIIWAAFIAQFGLEFLVAPDKRLYLRKRWVTAVSLALPALRLLRLARLGRLARVLRATRGVRLARLLATVNRGTLARHHLQATRPRLRRDPDVHRRDDGGRGDLPVRIRRTQRAWFRGLRRSTVVDGHAADDGFRLLAAHV